VADGHLDGLNPERFHAQGADRDPLDGDAVNLTLGNDVALCFVLMFARTAAVIMAIPQVLGVSVPVRLRMLLATLLAVALMPHATISMPSSGGILAIAILLLREIAIGIALAFMTVVVIGAVSVAGDLLGSTMEIHSGAILRGSVEIPNPLADSLGTLAGLIFFVGGFHRALIIGLARSVSALPLGEIALPRVGMLISMGGRLFVLALGLALPLMVPLFILALAQGTIARLAPQINVLMAAPAAILLAGLMLLSFDSLGLSWGITRAWESVTVQALGWMHG
jgi:flagellar biosynthesis protein FliR